MRSSIVGKVFSGLGRGGFFVSLEGYKSQLTDLLGGEPFSGTLNLQVDPGEVGKFLGGLQTHELTGFIEDGRAYGKIRYARIYINDFEAGLVVPEKTHYGKNTFEVVSTVNLRNKLDLSDGDQVFVTS